MSEPKQMRKEYFARLKAQGEKVFICGLEGIHSLETGVAYHYRGHFIYAWPSGNPIQPVPYSTKKGISVKGMVPDLVPPYDPRAKNLVREDTIDALRRARFHEQETLRRLKEAHEAEAATALEEEARQRAEAVKSANGQEDPVAVVPNVQELTFTRPSARTAHTTMLPSRSTSASRASSRNLLTSTTTSGHRPSRFFTQGARVGTVEAPRMSLTSTAALDKSQHFTPHSRAQFLAFSAPGSRHASATNTPQPSRPVSPASRPGLGTRSSLRPTASTSRLTQLLADEGMNGVFTPLLNTTRHRGRQAGIESEADTNTCSTRIDPESLNISHRPVFRSAQDASSALNDSTRLTGLGYRVETQCTSRKASPAPARPAMARDVYPTVETANGQMMIDWSRLVEEEKKNGGRSMDREG